MIHYLVVYLVQAVDQLVVQLELTLAQYSYDHFFISVFILASSSSTVPLALIFASSFSISSPPDKSVKVPDSKSSSNAEDRAFMFSVFSSALWMASPTSAISSLIPV